MDYSGFHDFPFPSKLDEHGKALKAFFLALPDNQQLQLLGGCQSYEEFFERVQSYQSSAISVR